MKVARFLLSVALLAGLSSIAFAQAPPLKIGVVDYGRLIGESPQGKAAQQTLNSEFEPKKKELLAQQTELKQRQEKYERESPTMSVADQGKAERDLREKLRALQQKQAHTQEDFEARRNEEMSRLQRLLVQEVQAYAKANGYDLVIATSAAIYMKDTLNITGAIMSALQAKGVKAPAAPAPKAEGAKK